MKTLIVVCFVLLSSLARAQGQPNLVGRWDLIGLKCSSGAPARGEFVPGRDSYNIEFSRDRFFTRAWVGGCQTFTEGNYLIAQRTLEMTVVRGSTNCGNPADLMGRFTYMYEKSTEKSFTVIMGPVRGGVCPSGDLVSYNYQLIE